MFERRNDGSELKESRCVSQDVNNKTVDNLQAVNNERRVNSSTDSLANTSQSVFISHQSACFASFLHFTPYSSTDAFRYYHVSQDVSVQRALCGLCDMKIRRSAVDS